MTRRQAPSVSSGGFVVPFAGFAAPTSNTTYAPNQFFDVCLPYSSRGVVRLVGYLIRKTLGWCDENGHPQAERHAVSYADFEAAGISRDMIRLALDEAIAGHFIKCVRTPQSKSAGKTAVSGLYELQWDERGEYVKNPKRFRGFFAGEGNRTYIPNQFFDVLVPTEPLAVIKVVGSVIRFSIGFQNKWGHRRKNVALSYRHIQNYSLLKDRKTLVGAIKIAMKSNYIERVEDGFFDPDGGRLSKAAVYAVKWLSVAAEETIGRKTPPAEIAMSNRSENPTGIGQKSLPADRSENPTDIEIKHLNKTLKQQQTPAATLERLKTAGFDATAAQAIASKFPSERIERQLRWIDQRHAKQNPLGLLRAAIRDDWPEPGSGGGRLGQPNFRRDAGADFGAALREASERLLGRSNSTTP
jgi:hypothetical protein